MSVLLKFIPFLRSFGFVFVDNITADFTNYNLRNRATAAGWDEVMPLIATVNLSSGKVISANSTSIYAFDTGTTAFPAGSSLALNMASAYICGRGGAGGANSVPAGSGGPALRVVASIPATINAAGGTTAGGGGGGGYSIANLAGGGGRSGRTNSTGGNAGTFTKGGDGLFGYPGYPLAAGGTTGPGGDGQYNPNGHGSGGGGGWGAAGGSGYNSPTPNPGGAGGAAVVGNAYITWINTGTRWVAAVSRVHRPSWAVPKMYTTLLQSRLTHIVRHNPATAWSVNRRSDGRALPWGWGAAK